MRQVFRNGVGVSNTRFLAAVSKSHTVVTYADILFNKVVIESDVSLIGGSITYDRNAAVLARGAVQFVERDISTGPGDPLTPYGYEVQIWTGIAFPDANDVVSMGIFPIQKSDIDGIGLGTALTLLDRSQLVIDAGFEDDYYVPAGENYAVAIRQLIAAGVPGLSYNFVTTAHSTPALVFDSQSDRWEAAQSMARSIGCELYFDGLGICTLRAEAVLNSSAPVVAVAEGTNGVLTAMDLSLDRATAYNKVIAFSENASTGAQYRGTATDADPASPTYYYGPFGRKPRFFGSPFLNSNSQCTSAAQAILLGNLGVARSLNFGMVPNPALDPGDAVTLTREALDVDEIQLIDGYTYGLGAAGSMECKTRVQQQRVT